MQEIDIPGSGDLTRDGNALRAASGAEARDTQPPEAGPGLRQPGSSLQATGNAVPLRWHRAHRPAAGHQHPSASLQGGEKGQLTAGSPSPSGLSLGSFPQLLLPPPVSLLLHGLSLSPLTGLCTRIGVLQAHQPGLFLTGLAQNLASASDFLTQSSNRYNGAEGGLVPRFL